MMKFSTKIGPILDHLESKADDKDSSFVDEDIVRLKTNLGMECDRIIEEDTDDSPMDIFVSGYTLADRHPGAKYTMFEYGGTIYIFEGTEAQVTKTVSKMAEKALGVKLDK